jgi:hypothetical protein
LGWLDRTAGALDGERAQIEPHVHGEVPVRQPGRDSVGQRVQTRTDLLERERLTR